MHLKRAYMHLKMHITGFPCSYILQPSEITSGFPMPCISVPFCISPEKRNNNREGKLQWPLNDIKNLRIMETNNNIIETKPIYVLETNERMDVIEQITMKGRV